MAARKEESTYAQRSTYIQRYTTYASSKHRAQANSNAHTFSIHRIHTHRKGINASIIKRKSHSDNAQANAEQTRAEHLSMHQHTCVHQYTSQSIRVQ